MDFSQLMLKGFAPKDTKIIKDNPNATIEQLREAGASQAALNRLMQLEDGAKEYDATDRGGPLQPKKVEQITIPGSNNGGGKSNPSDLVNFYNTTTGNTVPMKRSAAEFLVKSKKGRIVN